MEFETLRETDIKNDVAEILKKELHPSKIILFGSRTKNNFSKFSDFDFAVDSPKPSLEKLRKIKEKVEEVAGLYKVDIVFLCEAENEFLDIINSTGLILYEKRN